MNPVDSFGFVLVEGDAVSVEVAEDLRLALQNHAVKVLVGAAKACTTVIMIWTIHILVQTLASFQKHLSSSCLEWKICAISILVINVYFHGSFLAKFIINLCLWTYHILWPFARYGSLRFDAWFDL